MRASGSSKTSYVFFLFLALILGSALASSALAATDTTSAEGSNAPTIKSDKEDYPTRGTVVLTGDHVATRVVPNPAY